MASIAELPLAKRIARHGWWNTLGWVALRLAAIACGVRVLRGLVMEAMPAATAVPEGLAHGFQAPRALRRFAADPANEMPPFFVADAIARGDRCYAVCDGITPLSSSWYSRRPTAIGTPGLVLHFDPSYVCLYKAFTHPLERGRRLYAAGVSQVFPHFVAKGARGLLACVEGTNLESLKALRRMGFRAFGSICVVRLFGRHFCLATPGCRPYRLRLEHRPARRNRPQRLYPSAAHANVPVV